MRLVLDSAPLIHFSKIGFLAIAESLGHELLTTPYVMEEILPKGSRWPGSNAIEEALQNGRIKVRKHSMRMATELYGISAADASVILLAKETGATAVADDKAERLVARAIGVETISSAALIREAVRKKKTSTEEGMEWLDRLVHSGWYCDARTYSEIARAIRGRNER